MRTIKELLIVMLEHKEFFIAGLCAWANSLYNNKLINASEVAVLLKYIHHNRPKWYQKGLGYSYKRRNRQYYWIPYQIKIRIKWLEYHIQKNK